MQLYSRYLEALRNGSLEQRRHDIVASLYNYFEPAEGDSYFLMDPYLNVIDSIQEPLKSKTYEERIWSELISSLMCEGTKFRIITREPKDFSLHKDNTPYVIPHYESTKNVSIEVCKYSDTKYQGLALHDRFIIKQNQDINFGVHIGPSLEDISNKDISITKYDPHSIGVALKSFQETWDECVTNKGWKK